MTDRARNARDVRIVPGAGAASPTATLKRGAAGTSAVQLFRALAAQTSALASMQDAPCAEPQAEPDAPVDSGASSLDAETAVLPNPDATSGPLTPPELADALAEAEPPLAKTTLSIRSAARKKKQPAETSADDLALGQHIVRACASAAHGEVFTQQVAERIARFCAMTGATDDAAWEVTLPMNPAVLPETSLHLQLSPSRMVLRFETTDARSSQLIFDNTDALRTRLANVLSRQIDVDVIA
ncbi:hypothetical protein FAZ69_03435 [Trinickia terrae]|uniref:Uncharacterized protein n=1 Tax=Trinickia terrae TaxID=2571161 RepID=A0A4U1ID29_9BURK|nr:type III secretion system protein SctP [Trinickia terrae]TKC91519.1 hypothetical protein FAZ69_03435 [Trinickia terrae]